MKRFPEAIRITVTLFVTVCSISLFAQEGEFKSVNQATLLGVGKAFLTDTYLSPLEYAGLTTSLLHDRIGPTRHFNNKLLLQQQFQIDLAFTRNPSASASEYAGDVSYNINAFYPFFRNGRFSFFGGFGGDASLGGIYNVRNSNNPGSLKTSVNLDLSAMAIYSLRKVTLRWQLTTPFTGVFFSPAYGQSYYEIFSLGNDKGTVRFAWFQNQQALRNYFTLDIPFNNITLRAGYLGDYYRTDVSEIVTTIVSHQFVVGMAVESLNFGGKRARDNRDIKSSFY
ncbi:MULTISPECIES: DUF3316 domain-containing protein [Petrimonas]|jgi:hypothetical protein|uniref:DUF3316 domain-containing protein n=1 Tax=Petrimonas mucosa TaxID=1642646 RepID=A0A1G4G957_9BACT|nr:MULTISPECIES: DUF3316 domain-containing protein [Petrimonas]MDD3561711.1 DUF3316 domain-containing protein [Petrimonas mucosa]SCM59086.1 putative protein {ECO:0000313/EMBL:CEA16032,1} [Petrimonas mucosa]SFU54854.1 Protein of unknown function [Porphyromonadaceae bacterium KHP3R9]HHT30185.1 DUF3316 domain-containing protein [Petrimonas mucosa]